MDESRWSRKVNLTMTPAAVEVLESLVAEDAERLGTDIARQRSATVRELVMAERARRDRRAEKK